MSTEPATSDLRARILAEVAKTPAPTRVEHRRRVLVVSALGALATTAVFVATGGMAPGARPLEMIAFTAGFGLVAAVVLTRLAAGNSGSMLGRPRPVLVTACVVTAPLLALSVLAAAAAWPEPASSSVAFQKDVACGLIAIVQGLLPLVALLVPRRGSDPVHPVVTGAALGMTAGAWTATMAALRCPHAAPMHCIVAHAGPTLVLTAVGAALGWMLLRVRPVDGGGVRRRREK